MVCVPVRSIIPSLFKLGDYLSVQAHKPCSISHIITSKYVQIIYKAALHKRDVINVLNFANLSCKELYMLEREVIARSMASLKDNEI